MEILDARESLEDAQSEEDMEKVRAANAGASSILSFFPSFNHQMYTHT